MHQFTGSEHNRTSSHVVTASLDTTCRGLICPLSSWLWEWSAWVKVWPKWGNWCFGEICSVSFWRRILSFTVWLPMTSRWRKAEQLIWLTKPSTMGLLSSCWWRRSHILEEVTWIPPSAGSTCSPRKYHSSKVRSINYTITPIRVPPPPPQSKQKISTQCWTIIGPPSTTPSHGSMCVECVVVDTGLWRDSIWFAKLWL